MTTDVAFGIDLDCWDKDLVAIMPGIAADIGRPDLATCYVSIGGHSSCSITGILSRCSQADYDEYKGLLVELKRIGYDVSVVSLDSIDDADYEAARREQLGL